MTFFLVVEKTDTYINETHYHKNISMQLEAMFTKQSYLITI